VFIAVALSGSLDTARPAAQPEPTVWRDPSPHQARFVAVEPGVQLEVLDWGGSGRPIVLLAGSGNSAHVFDDLAPRLTDSRHIYGITRRGHGVSSQPASGYDDQRLADDVLRVSDSLQIDAPVLVGHSMAGAELTTLGNQHSNRLAGLVYLDALADPRDDPSGDPAWLALQQKLPPPTPSSCTQDRTTFATYRFSLQCSLGFLFPESELRSMFMANADGRVGEGRMPQRVGQAIGVGQKKRDYSNILVPVLALFEFPRTSLAQLRSGDPQPRTDEEGANVVAFALATKVFSDRWVGNLTRAVPNARLVDLPGAGHYVFLTRQADVVREVRQFATGVR